MASELRQRVTFAQRALASDGYGNAEGAFEDQFTVSAAITPRFGGETVMAARLSGRQPLTIKVRQSSETRQIGTDWQAKNARTGQIYNIRSIIDPYMDSPRHGRFFELLVEAGAEVS